MLPPNYYTPYTNELLSYDQLSLSVSVVVPVYNIATLVDKTLAALIAQGYPRELTEIIIVDDGSDDDVLTVVRKYEKLAAIKFITHAHKGNRASTIRNKGILASNGEVIISLDGDCIPSRNLILEHVRMLQACRNSITLGPRRFIDSSLISPKQLSENPDICYELPEIPSVSKLKNTNNQIREETLFHFQDLTAHPKPYTVVHSCNMGYFKEDALEVGLFDEGFNGHYGFEDIEFAYRLWMKGNFVIPISKAIVFHQENNVLGKKERIAGNKRNFAYICDRIPTFKEDWVRSRLWTIYKNRTKNIETSTTQ